MIFRTIVVAVLVIGGGFSGWATFSPTAPAPQVVLAVGTINLTNAQKTTLQAFVAADAVLNAIPKTADGAFELAAALNTEVTTFFVWKSEMDASDMNDGLVFTAVDQLSANKARIYEWMQMAGTINPSTNSVRQGITQCFGAGSATETNILALMKRNATRLEQVFANTSGGNGAEATPAKLNNRVEGEINPTYLKDVMGW